VLVWMCEGGREGGGAIYLSSLSDIHVKFSVYIEQHQNPSLFRIMSQSMGLLKINS